MLSLRSWLFAIALRNDLRAPGAARVAHRFKETCGFSPLIFAIPVTGEACVIVELRLRQVQPPLEIRDPQRLSAVSTGDYIYLHHRDSNSKSLPRTAKF
jgi:hypothetical protein